MNIQNHPALPNRNPFTQRLEGDLSPVAPDSRASRLPDYDIITIGGGINGSGIARDAAERGLRVLLLEKNDFGGGTSAYSSRLIHGGLRYLANAEFGLVHESLQERELLLKNAPHLVRPLQMAIPIYQKKSPQKPKWMVKLGMTLYDMLSPGKSVPGHRMLGRQDFLAQYPGVNPAGLKGGPVYYDAQVELPERICVENAIAARNSGNATVLNHAQVTGLQIENRQAAGVTFTDVLTGEQFLARGKVIINAAGPWVDEVLKQSVPEIGSPRLIGGTKGSHIIVNRFPGAPETALYVEAQSDGRPFFIIPWRRDTYLIGTTDLHYGGSLDQVVADRDEVAYLLRETNIVLPEAGLSERDVLYTYSGVRPLPYAGGKKEGKITRKHIIRDHGRDATSPVGQLLSIIGGKLTTYRHLAEEAVDYAVKHYRLQLPSGQAVPKTTTRRQPLPGGADIANLADYKHREVPSSASEFGMPEAVVSHLIDLYGGRYRNVLLLTHNNPLLKLPLHEGSLDIGAQVVYAIREEMAQTVTDVLLRRLGNGLNPDAGLSAAEPVALIMARELDWPPTEIQAQINAYKTFLTQTNLAFRQPVPVVAPSNG